MRILLLDKPNLPVPGEISDFEEAVGEFRDSGKFKDHMIVVLQESRSILLPLSASEALDGVKIGDRVGIIRTNGAVRVRIFSDKDQDPEVSDS